MAFKEINDLNADTTVSMGGVNKKTGKANPTKVEGYYLGKRQVEDRKTKSGFSYIYILQTPKGNLGVWGKTDLNNKMSNAVPGHMLRITQTGKVGTPNGEMYKFKVEFDETNTVAVASPLEAANSSADEYSGGGAEAYSDNSAEEEDSQEFAEAEETYVQTNALSAQARKEKVESLLKNKRK